MKRKHNNRDYIELIACEEAAERLREALVKKFQLLCEKSNLSTDDTIHRLVCNIKLSDDYDVIYERGNHLFNEIKSQISTSRSIIENLSLINEIETSLQSDLSTLQVINGIRQEIGTVLQFDCRKTSSLKEKKAATEVSFNRMVLQPENKKILKANITIKPTGFIQRCIEAWNKFWGNKLSTSGRFFQTENIAQQAVSPSSPPKSLRSGN